MFVLLLAVGLLLASGFAALLSQRSARWATACGVCGTVSACLIALVPATQALLSGVPQTLRLAWAVPYGALALRLDALSAFFLLPICVLSALAAVYGGAYLWEYRERRSLGAPWFFFNVLVASMMVVVLASNGVLFIIAWEVMALASFFLVTFEDEQESVRTAGWVYLVATHFGTAFILAFFVLLGHGTGSLDFDQFAAAPAMAGVLFILALVGFGTKAGIVPLHVWLPEAHPAAPSHVSALMSGVMIKTGIYGIVRALSFLGDPSPWWGWMLCGAGVASGVFGVIFALAQRDLKRLLAYSSVENIGIITLGLGVGVLGISAHLPALAVMGFAGALLHVWNHSVFKGLLFLGAGAVVHATGTRDIDRLGGLLTRMPWVGRTWIIGAVAICGLPPLNGFASEFLIYLGATHGAVAASAPTALPLLGVIAGLALIGGLAAACFARAVGIAFFGAPRSDEAAHAHDAALALRLPLTVLAAGCLVLGLGAPLLVRGLAPLLAEVTGLSSSMVNGTVTAATAPLTSVTAAASLLLIVIALLAAWRSWLLSGRRVDTTITWDCGYAQPTARMQYTAASFAQPLTDLFDVVLQTQHRNVLPDGLFPHGASLASTTPDLCAERLYRPVFAGVGRGLASLRWLQHGRVHLYILYIALTLLLLLIWQLG